MTSTEATAAPKKRRGAGINSPEENKANLPVHAEWGVDAETLLSVHDRAQQLGKGAADDTICSHHTTSPGAIRGPGRVSQQSWPSCIRLIDSGGEPRDPDRSCTNAFWKGTPARGAQGRRNGSIVVRGAQRCLLRGPGDRDRFSVGIAFNTRWALTRLGPAASCARSVI